MSYSICSWSTLSGLEQIAGEALMTKNLRKLGTKILSSLIESREEKLSLVPYQSLKQRVSIPSKPMSLWSKTIVGLLFPTHPHKQMTLHPMLTCTAFPPLGVRNTLTNGRRPAKIPKLIMYIHPSKLIWLKVPTTTVCWS